MKLAFASYLDTIVREADRLDDLRSANLEKRVPARPDWTARQLLGHLSDVLGYWTEQVLAGDASAAVEHPRTGDAAGVAPAADRAVAALAEVGPDAACWNWSGDELTAEWVARHLAVRTTVHRVDGEQSQGRAQVVQTDLAMDGIEHRLTVDLGHRLGASSDASLGGSICLVADDAPAAYVVDVERGRIRWRHGRGPADTVLVAPTSTLFLFVWNRLASEPVALTGDPRVAEAWNSLPAC